jgi:RimJ/RimL family protein N-acetyltransferase
MLSVERLALPNGETGLLEVYAPAGPAEYAQNADHLDALWEMVVQPRQPWFSRSEWELFTRALRGQLTPASADRFYAIWIAGRPAAHVFLNYAADHGQVAQVGFVVTEPAFRGRGLCSLLMTRVIADFRERGGQCALLGTGNPVAHAIYARAGFSDYIGHTMRYLADASQPAHFDREYFAYRRPARPRAGHWGDGARLAWLYASRCGSFVKHYSEGIYEHPAITHVRCCSILPALMLNVEERRGGLWVLETPDGRLVGTASLTLSDTTAQHKAPLLDFTLTPAYWGQAADLLHKAIDAAWAGGANVVRACLASCDHDKAEVLQSLAFRLEATLAGQFVAGDERYDLNVYVLE